MCGQVHCVVQRGVHCAPRVVTRRPASPTLFSRTCGNPYLTPCGFKHPQDPQPLRLYPSCFICLRIHCAEPRPMSLQQVVPALVRAGVGDASEGASPGRIAQRSETWALGILGVYAEPRRTESRNDQRGGGVTLTPHTLAQPAPVHSRIKPTK